MAREHDDGLSRECHAARAKKNPASVDAGFPGRVFLMRQPHSCAGQSRVGAVPCGTSSLWKQPPVGAASAAKGACLDLARCRGIAAEAAPTRSQAKQAKQTKKKPGLK